ncbi:MAG: hypothetical protein AAF984_10390 [Verrucomicrobiota bacterium]
MQAYEAWSELSPELNHEILESAYLNNKKLYRTVLEECGSQLRKRVAGLKQLPRKERHMIFLPVLSLPMCHVVTQNLLMNWLGKDKVEMLNKFLDGLNIEHDGSGCASNFPEKMDSETLKLAVDTLYEKFDESAVSLYLKTFDSLTGMNWSGIDDLIRTNKVENVEAENSL